MNDSSPMLSFIMTPVYKNRSREADNPAAQAAYEEGEKHKITDPEKALIWYNKAANLGHRKAPYEVERIRKKLNMKGSINPKAHNRNLEETNKKHPKPIIKPSLRLDSENKAQVTAVYNQPIITRYPSGKRKLATEVPMAPDNKPKKEKTKDPEREKLKRDARNGDKKALYELGKERIEKGLQYLRKSAEKQYAPAQAEIDKLYLAATPPSPPAPEPIPEPAPVLYTTERDYPHTAEEPLLLEYIYGVSEIPAELPSQTVDWQPDYPVVPPLSCTYTAETHYSIRDIFQIILSYIRQKLGRAKAKPTAIEELKSIQPPSCPTASAIWSSEAGETQNYMK